MQHQPQEHQPHPSPEFVPFEQPQAYPPQPRVYMPSYQQSAQETPQSSEQVQDIVIYANRRKIILYLAFLLSVFIFAIAPFSLIAFSGTFLGIDMTLRFLSIPMAIVLAAIVLYIWLIWSTASLIFPTPKPVLIISREGIMVGKWPLHSSAFVSWAAIDTISRTDYFIYKYLCIVPKNTDQFLSVQPLERWQRRLNSVFFGSPLYFPQFLLEKSVDEIMHELMYSTHWPGLNFHRHRTEL